MKTKPLILIIDDEDAILKSLQQALQDENYHIEILQNPASALSLIGQLIPDLVLLDISMPYINGIDLLKQIKKEYPAQDVIMISGYGTIQTALESIKNGARDFIEKPLNLDEILSKIDYLKQPISTKESQDQNRNNFVRYGIVGESYLFLELMNQLLKIAPLKLPVLLYGPYGSGRSLLAEFVHSQSEYPGAITHLDCSGEFDEKLIDELFKTPGSVHIKNIQQLSISFQKKLLSALETSDPIKTRIIASATPDLYKYVQKQTFNVTLFYKLNVTPLEIPALNKRRYDIPILIAYFCEEIKKFQKKTLIFPHSSIRILRNKDWAGNILELKQFIEKISLHIKDDYFVITPEELQKYLTEKELQFIQEQTFATFASLNDALNQFEKKFITYLLKKNCYNLTQVSDRLHIDVPLLKLKLLELNIDFKSLYSDTP
jgi:DNA-binding NtrC family response regulator